MIRLGSVRYRLDGKGVWRHVWGCACMHCAGVASAAWALDFAGKADDLNFYL